VGQLKLGKYTDSEANFAGQIAEFDIFSAQQNFSPPSGNKN
jgi:hypothetical protein